MFVDLSNTYGEIGVRYQNSKLVSIRVDADNCMTAVSVDFKSIVCILLSFALLLCFQSLLALMLIIYGPIHIIAPTSQAICHSG